MALLRTRQVISALAHARIALRCSHRPGQRGPRQFGRQQHPAAHRGAAALAAVASLKPPEISLTCQPPVATTAKKAQMYCLVRNTEVLPCQQSSGAWLDAAPRGAYTTARTVGGGTSVFELSFHIQRLADSAALMMQADAAGTAGQAGAPATAKAALDVGQLRPRLLASLRAAVQAYRAAAGEADGELRLTVLLTWAGCQQAQQGPGGAAGNGGPPATVSPTGTAGAGAGADIFVHVGPLPPRAQPPVRVVMRGSPRQNAAAKDSEWVRQRKALEAGLPADVNEAILVGEGGSLYEGLTSNFFAVLDGTVYTAGEGVLAGTVREVALAVARREGIPVVLEPPRLADMGRWEGCFITSTSRLLLPVDEASVFIEPSPAAEAAAGGASAAAAQGAVGQGTQQAAETAAAGAVGTAGAAEVPPPRRFERGGLVHRLEQLVLDEVAACSEPLFE